MVLVHHGIIGQKWGVRRFQKRDGTLTPEGKARYGYDENASQFTRKDYKNAKKDIRELAKHTYSSKKEDQRRLATDQMNKEDIRKIGDKWAKDEHDLAFKSNSDREYNYRAGKLEARAYKEINEYLLKKAGYSDAKAKAGAEYIAGRLGIWSGEPVPSVIDKGAVDWVISHCFANKYSFN